MAYENGTWTDVVDLLNKLSTFAQAIGWTIDRNAIPISNGAWLQLHHAEAGYHNIVCDTNVGDVNTASKPGPWIYCFGSTGSSATDLFNAQPGSSWRGSNNTATNGANIAAGTNAVRGAGIAYHFFGTTKYLHIVVEITSGEYAHFGVGILDKSGSFSGGEYGYGTIWEYLFSNVNADSSHAHDNQHSGPFDGRISSITPQSSSGYVRIDVDGYTNEWCRCSSSVTATSSVCAGPTMATSEYSYYRNPMIDQWNWTPNSINGIAPLIPSLIMVQIRNTKCYAAGTLHDFRFVNMTNIVPGQVVTIGSDRWHCFPYKAKGAVVDLATPGLLNSWRYGVALREIP